LKTDILRSLAWMLCIFLICSCALAQQNASESGYPKKIVDSAGREITLQMPVERIIVLSTDAAEAVTMLGAADKVVGVSDSVKNKAYYFSNLKDKQSIGKWNDPDYEMIGEIAKKGDAIVPDIIVIGYSYPDKPYGINAVDKKLETFGNITAVALDFYKPENMTAEIEKLGIILGKEEEAKDYIDWYDEKDAQVEQAIEGQLRPKVYVEWSSKSGELSTLGSGSGADGMVKVAGGNNIAKDLEDSYPKVGWEWVVSESPDFVIIRQTQPSGQESIGWSAGPSQDTVKLENVINELASREGAKSLSAAKNDNIYAVDWDVMAGLDQVVGLTYLAKMLHPDADLDPVSVHKEYLQRLGLEYPEERIFVYPELQ